MKPHHFDLVHQAIEFIRLHAAWAGPLMFVVSFGESFVGFSLLFPGTTIMVLAGTMVRWPLNPHGFLDVWPLLIGGFSGAVIGDAISFWAGERFGHLLDRHWYFVRHPDLLPRGYAFFERFGVASVFVGRFFGPVRAVIPLVAGIMRMGRPQFWIANLCSAVIWAPALLLVGTVFSRIAEAVGPLHHWRLIASVVLAIVVMAAIWAAERYRLLDRLRGKRTESPRV